MSNKSVKSIFFRTYPDRFIDENYPSVTWKSEIPKILNELGCIKYAMILHDKDIDENTGLLKEPHIHCIATFKKTMWLPSLCKVLKCELIATNECSNVTACFRYLTHADNPEKYQYSNLEVIKHGSWEYIVCDKDISTDLSIIINYIRDLQEISTDRKWLFNKLFDFVLENDLTNIYRKYYFIIRDLI